MYLLKNQQIDEGLKDVRASSKGSVQCGERIFMRCGQNYKNQLISICYGEFELIKESSHHSL